MSGRRHDAGIRQSVADEGHVSSPVRFGDGERSSAELGIRRASEDESLGLQYRLGAAHRRRQVSLASDRRCHRAFNDVAVQELQGLTVSPKPDCGSDISHSFAAASWRGTWCTLGIVVLISSPCRPARRWA
jgi:hypothetical protein